MQRGIDHLALCVRDLEAAAARYSAFGFTTTPRATELGAATASWSERGAACPAWRHGDDRA